MTLSKEEIKNLKKKQREYNRTRKVSQIIRRGRNKEIIRRVKELVKLIQEVNDVYPKPVNFVREYGNLLEHKIKCPKCKQLLHLDYVCDSEYLYGRSGYFLFTCKCGYEYAHQKIWDDNEG